MQHPVGGDGGRVLPLNFRLEDTTLDPMGDEEIIGRIDELVAEEHELRARATGTGLDAAGQARFSELEKQLDRCWDLLRQRRAREEFGENPDEAQPRPVDEVESYRQ